MRFRGTSSPTPYWNKGFQFRMILLVVALSLVIVAIQKTSNPKFWAIWFPEETPVSESSRNAPVNSNPASLRSPDRNTLEEDEFLVAQARKSEPELGDSPLLDETNSADETISDAEDDVPSSFPMLKSPNEPRDVPIDRERLHSLEDHAVGIRPNEAEAFYYLLDHAAHVPLDQLRSAGEPNVAREALLKSPDYFRGTPIHLEGEIRRLQVLDATPNIFAIDRYFDAWILPPATGNTPWRVVSLDVDGQLPIDELIEDSVRVRVSGYFFKLEGYAANSGLIVTPVLVARKIEAVPPRPENPLVSGTSNPWRWLFVGFCLVFALAVWSVVRSTRGSRRTREYRKQSLEPKGDLSGLAGQESFRPEAHLRELLDENEQDD